MLKALSMALILSSAAAALGVDGAASIEKRDGFVNVMNRFQTEGKGTVAFLGGSITEMNGYRPMVAESLKARFPKAEFTFINAGLASTCSTTGAFRLERDILSKGKVDLLFVDFAVNDDQDAHHSREECMRGMEGIVRHLRSANPSAQVVFLYFVNEHLMDQYRKGMVPLSISAHEEVAKAYGVPSVDIAKAVTARIDAGEFDFAKYGGVHPAPFGCRIAADMVDRLFDECAKSSPGTAKSTFPERPLDALNYGDGRFLDLKSAKTSPEWQLHVPDWEKVPGSKRSNYTQLPVLETTSPGASLTLDFEGAYIGAFILAGPDAGTALCSVDGSPERRVDLWHPYSAGLNYPRSVVFADALPAGRHTLSLKISPESNKQSKGAAVRIMNFEVNSQK